MNRYCLISLLFFCLCQSVTGQEKENKNVKIHKIPLSEIYSTNGQEGVKHVQRGQETYTHDLNEIYRFGQGTGPSNVFLVRGVGLSSAIRATRKAFTGGRSADSPIGPDDGTKGHDDVWLVAYFGVSGSAPPEWFISSAERRGTMIRLYFKKGQGAKTLDVHPYLVWVPLGEISKGVYDVELFDTEKRAAILIRRVTVESVK